MISYAMEGGLTAIADAFDDLRGGKGLNIIVRRSLQIFFLFLTKFIFSL